MQILDQWNDNLDQEQKTKVLRDNFLTLDKAIQMMGLYLLRSTTNRIAQAVSSTSFVALTAWQSAVTTNGGLIIVYWDPYLKFDGGGNLTLALSVDGIVQKTQAGMGLAANAVVINPFMWAGQLAAGSHTFNFSAKVNAGTQTVGNASSDTSMYVFEFVKG